jgi:hypothetical protein
LKGAHSMLVFALLELIFYKYNSYLLNRRGQANDFIQHEIMWPQTIQVELTINKDRLKDYTTMLFNDE